MLVLTRSAGEVIKIGDDIEVRILRMAGNDVIIGIEADRAIPINRGELFDHRRQQGQKGEKKALAN